MSRVFHIRHAANVLFDKKKKKLGLSKIKLGIHRALHNGCHDTLVTRCQENVK